jgi:hypothetical protein
MLGTYHRHGETRAQAEQYIKAKPPTFINADMMATPKVISDLPKSAITIIKSGKSLKSPERYGHNENDNKCLRKYKVIY